jgi:hypothetical protein
LPQTVTVIGIVEWLLQRSSLTRRSKHKPFGYVGEPLMRSSVKGLGLLIVVSLLAVPVALIGLDRTMYRNAVSYVRDRGGYVDDESRLFGQICLDLDWSHCDVTDAELAYVVRLQPSSYIRLDGNPRITDHGLARLVSIRAPFSVSVRKTAVTLDGIRAFQAVARHPFTDVTHNIVDVDANGGATEIAAAAKLIWRNYVGVTTDTHGVVTALQLEKKHVNRKLLTLLPAFPGLTRVDLPGESVSDAELELICQCKSLRSLFLGHSNVTDDGLKHLVQLSRLESLYLNDTETTDSGVESITALPNLAHLGLSGTQVTDGGVQRLAKSTTSHQLKSLGLGQTRISDAALSHLAAFTSLSYLSLYDTDTSKKAVNELQRRLKNCEFGRY